MSEHALSEVSRFNVWYAAYQITQETERHTFGKPGYDMTLDHIHEVAQTIVDAMDAVTNAEEPQQTTEGHGHGSSGVSVTQDSQGNPIGWRTEL